jgi:muramoyltetrapeptide carboxypeptidase
MLLDQGDLVAVVAPSGPVDMESLAAGAARLRSWGLRVRVGAGRERALGYLAGDDAARAAEFTEAWADPEVAAVVCARGGYGAQRMIDLVDWGRVVAAGPKVFVGCSDITALHQVVRRRLNQVTLFGPMPAGTAFNRDAATANSLHRALFSGLDVLSVPAPEVLVPGCASGTLDGGTLALLASSVGTPDGGPLARPRIVFLEDVDEAPYRLDRYLTQLLRSGWFEGVHGVVLGAFIACGDHADVHAVITDRLAPLGIPILAGLPAGHGTTQLTLPLGAPVTLDTTAGTLNFS